MNRNGRLWEESSTIGGDPVGAGDTYIVVLPDGGPLSVSVSPGEGGSVEVYYTSAPIADITDEGPALWFPWTPGSVEAATRDVTPGPTRGVKIVATGAAARYEICQRSSMY